MGQVTDYLAAKLGKTKKSIAGGIADLIEKGYLSTGGESDNTGKFNKESIFITHKGWQAYSRWDISKVDCGYSEPNAATLEEWLEWDGVDCQPIPFDFAKPLPWEN